MRLTRVRTLFVMSLVAFLVGDSGRRWAALDEDERRRSLLSQVERYFGPQAARPNKIIAKSWAEEPWTRGCPTGALPPGALTQLGPAIREACDRIHWAGTETASDWCGYMEGALESAERASKEVLARL